MNNCLLLELDAIKKFYQQKILFIEKLEKYISAGKILPNNVFEKLGSLFDIMQQGDFTYGKDGPYGIHKCVDAMTEIIEDGTESLSCGTFENQGAFRGASANSFLILFQFIPCTRELEFLIAKAQLSLAHWVHSTQVDEIDEDYTDDLEARMGDDIAEMLKHISKTPFIQNMLKVIQK